MVLLVKLNIFDGRWYVVDGLLWESLQATEVQVYKRGPFLTEIEAWCSVFNIKSFDRYLQQ